MTDFLIDLGNTSCKVAFEESGSLKRIYRSKYMEDTESFILSFLEETRPDIIVFSNVREEKPELEKKLAERCRKLVVLDYRTGLSMGVKYRFPAEGLGADRIAGAIGALTLFPGKDIIKFDFGTALTVDFISGDAVIEGGNISLGLTTRFRALNAFAKRLPLIKPVEDIPEMGIDTGSALTCGVVFGLMFEVAEYMRRYPGRLAIFTGGDSFYFAKKMKKNAIFVAPNLVLMGLAQIAKYYAEKQN